MKTQYRQPRRVCKIIVRLRSLGQALETTFDSLSRFLLLHSFYSLLGDRPWASEGMFSVELSTITCSRDLG